jgi:hypothetical protein
MLIAAIAVVLVVAIAAVVTGGLVSRRRRAPAVPAAPLAPAGPPPMSDLESALSQVTDRAGRPIRDAIDAEAGHVDDLRVPDDTGPLLRRALDHVARPGETQPSQPVEPEPGSTDDAP